MNQKRGIKVGFIAAAIALLIVAVAVPAGAGNPNVNCHKQDLNRLLTGDYYGSASFVCAGSTWGFNETDLGRKPLVIPPNINYPMDGYNLGGSSQGVTSYDGHGGYTYKGEVLSIIYETAGSAAPAKYPVSQYDMQCKGNYEVDEHLKIRSWDGVCTLTAKAGPYASVPGFKLVISNLEGKGQLIGTMGNILMVRADTEPNLELVEIHNNPGFPPEFPNPFTMERICTGSGTAMEIVGKGNNLRERGK